MAKEKGVSGKQKQSVNAKIAAEKRAKLKAIEQKAMEHAERVQVIRQAKAKARAKFAR